MFVSVDDLIRELTAARDGGLGDDLIGITHASSGNPEHKESGVFRVLTVDTEHGINLVQSNYIEGYIPATFPDQERNL